MITVVDSTSTPAYTPGANPSRAPLTAPLVGSSSSDRNMYVYNSDFYFFLRVLILTNPVSTDKEKKKRVHCIRLFQKRQEICCDVFSIN